MKNLNSSFFKSFPLDENDHIFIGQLPKEFAYTKERFQQIWDLHPNTFQIFELEGKKITTPRWQQAYGKSFRYPGSKDQALLIHDLLMPYHRWCLENIDKGLNSLLLNWYEGEKKHFIRPHRDHTDDLIEGSPIVTISLGEERIFRIRPWQAEGLHDFKISHGDVVIIPWQTNLRWTHEIPLIKSYRGRRISLTLRAVKE